MTPSNTGETRRVRPDGAKAELKVRIIQSIQGNTTMKTTTTTTVAKAKAKKTTTAKAQQATAAAVPFFAQLLTDALAGKFGPYAARYYSNANSYHKKMGTVFPRAVTADARASLTMNDVKSVMEQATKGILAAGSRKGQAVYDLMRIGADKTAVKAK